MNNHVGVSDLKKIIGEEITLVDLSNELAKLEYEDIFDLNLNDILEDRNVVLDDIQIFFSNVNGKDDLMNCTVQIDGIHPYFN